MYYAELAFYYVFLTALVLSVVVFVHEFGHFYAARRFGVKVEAFSIGFGREIWGRTDRFGMRWKICIVPFGGYVAFRGENILSGGVAGEGAYASAPNWQRAVISLAGPFANFLLALLIMFGLFLVEGKTIATPIVGAVEVGSGADQAGVRVDDRFASLNGVAAPENFYEYTKIVNDPQNKVAYIVLLRNGEMIEKEINLQLLKEEDDFGDQTKRRVMGVVLGRGAWKLSAINAVDGIETKGNPDLARKLIVERLGRDMVVNFGQIKKPGDEVRDYRLRLDVETNAGLHDPESVFYDMLVYGRNADTKRRPMGILESAGASFDFSMLAIKKVSGVIYQMIVGKKDTGDLGGVVKIGEMTGGVVRQAEFWGYAAFFRLIAAISVNIGFLNLLPLPMLDGGRLMFNLYEAVARKPASLRVQAYFMAGSVGFVVALVFIINLKDFLEIFVAS